MARTDRRLERREVAMAFLRTASPFDHPVIAGDGLFLRTPSLADYLVWTKLARREPRLPHALGADLAGGRSDAAPPSAAASAAIRPRCATTRLSVLHLPTGESTLLGGITLSNVTRGMTQTATLGYWMGERHANRGHMTRAVRALAPFAFRALHLHRLEAACLPHNRCVDAAPGESRLPPRGTGARPRLHQRPLAGSCRLLASQRRPSRHGAAPCTLMPRQMAVYRHAIARFAGL